MSTGEQSTFRIRFKELTILAVSAGTLLGKRETDTVLVAGVVRDLIAVVHAVDGSQFTAATFAVVRLEQPGDANDGFFWNETSADWEAAATANQVATHLEAGQHLYLLPAAATVGRVGAVIHYTFTNNLTEGTATTVCSGSEHNVVAAALTVGGIVDGVWDEATVNHQAAGTFGLAANSISVRSTVAAAPAPTATTFATGLTQVDGFWVNMLCIVINASGEAVARNVDAFANTDGLFTVAALPFTPVVGDVVLVLRRAAGVSVNAEVVPSTGACD